MEDNFLQRKCKECRYQACLRAGMRKEYLQGTKKIKKDIQVDPAVAGVIDPGQQRLLLIAIEFWR